MRPARRRLIVVATTAAAVLSVAAIVGAVKLKRYVDTDPGLCAQCHRASPEFALWNQGSHKGVACQRCHHASPEEGLAMLRAFLAGKSPAGKKPHAEVQVGACAACHLSHDPKWPQIEGSRGHRIHVAENRIECVKCHGNAMHGFQPVVDSCKECHGEHLVRGAPGMQQLHCFGCHEFLSTDPGLRPTRRDCLRCHRAQGVHPARFVEGAPMQFSCGECHHPHDDGAQRRIDCHTCHPQVERGGLHGIPGHGDCARCHQPHVWRTGAQTCSGCHAHAQDHARGRACSVCHSFAGTGTPRPPKPPGEPSRPQRPGAGGERR